MDASEQGTGPCRQPVKDLTSYSRIRQKGKTMSLINSRQEAFVREYMIDHNGAQAAVRAGYSPKTARVTACKLLTKANIKRSLGELERKAEAKAEKCTDDVLRRLIDIAWTDLTEIADFDGQSMTFRSFKKLTPAQRACIKDFKVKAMTKLDEEGKPIEVDMVEIKLHDKLKALELYAKYIGMEREAKKDALPIFQLRFITEGKKSIRKKPSALPA